MTDRELLELAAKAAGIAGAYDDAIKAVVYPNGSATEKYGDCYSLWNPLTDDGEALRLAVKLLFEIDMGRGCIAIRHSTGVKILEAFNQDPYAATRRAIVRAAAEIGKAVQKPLAP